MNKGRKQGRKKGQREGKKEGRTDGETEGREDKTRDDCTEMFKAVRLEGIKNGRSEEWKDERRKGRWQEGMI